MKKGITLSINNACQINIRFFLEKTFKFFIASYGSYKRTYVPFFIWTSTRRWRFNRRPWFLSRIRYLMSQLRVDNYLSERWILIRLLIIWNRNTVFYYTLDMLRIEISRSIMMKKRLFKIIHDRILQLFRVIWA